jgi:hypothetical protein
LSSTINTLGTGFIHDVGQCIDTKRAAAGRYNTLCAHHPVTPGKRRAQTIFSELRERFRYLIDRAFAREFAGPLLMFVALVVGATLVGMTASFFGLFAAENAHVAGIPRDIDEGFWDSLWWSLHQVIRLRAFEQMYGASGPILAYATFLSLMGLAVFGVLVSLINNAMRSRIDRLQQGDTAVKERGHVLVLGWNNRILSVLHQLAQLKPGVRVVILSTRRMDKMTDTLRVARVFRENLTIVLRSGIPSNREELDRVAVDRASSIIVLSSGKTDSEAIKTLVLLASRSNWPGTPPTLTAEIGLEKNFELAEIGARGRVHIVSSSRVISKVIVQTVRNPGLARVYDELMSTAGNSIYVQTTAECTDLAFREFSYGFRDAVPIGVTWAVGEGVQARHSAGLNLEPDYDVPEDERLVLLSKGLPARYQAPGSAYTSNVYHPDENARQRSPRVLLIGWTDILYDILRELNAHALDGAQVTVLSGLSKGKARKMLDRHLQDELPNLSLSFCEGDATERSGYEGTDLNDYDSLVVLADDNASDGDADTRTLRVLLRLTDLAKQVPITANIVIELLDQNNRGLFTGLGVKDIVASAEVISAQMAQIARQPVLGAIYRELLSAGGIEISLRVATDYVGTGNSCVFDDLTYAAQQRLETALGLIVDDEVLLNPPRETRWELGANDRVIVLAQQVYR